MSLETTAVDILQAGMEAVAYRFAAVQRLLDAAAGPAGQTVATGGALFRSRAWTQIISDVLERPVTLSRVSEASSRAAHRAAASRQESLCRLLAGDGENVPGT